MAFALNPRTVRTTVLGLAAFGLVSAGVTTALSAKDTAAKADKVAAVAAAPKHTIEDVMKKAYKGKTSLIARLSEGKGTQADVTQLLEFNQALAASKPTMGEQADWDQRTAALLKATEALKAGDRTAPAALKAASDCKACHKLHKES